MGKFPEPGSRNLSAFRNLKTLNLRLKFAFARTKQRCLEKEDKERQERPVDACKDATKGPCTSASARQVVEKVFADGWAHHADCVAVQARLHDTLDP